MTGGQVVGRIALAVLVVGLLAAAGYAVYRLGFSPGVASAGPMGDMRSFMSERGPRFGWPDRFDPFLQEPRLLRPEVRVQVFRHAVMWPVEIGLGTPLLSIGFLLLSGIGVVAVIVLLFRWAFRPSGVGPEAEQAEKS